MATRRSTRGGLAFLVTFLAFLVIFGAVGVWGLTEYWQHTNTPKGETTPTTTAPTEAATHRLLLITEQDGEAQGFLLISAGTAQRYVEITSLPRETAVTTGLQQTRLCDLYKGGNMPALTAQVATLTGQPVQHYAVLSYRNLEKWIAWLGGGVVYTLTEPVSYQSSGGLTTNMPAGTHTLSGVQVTDLLRYRGWYAGDAGRAAVQGDMAAAILNQYFLPARFEENSTDFSTFINLVRSNLLASDYAEARDDLLVVAKRNQFNICRSLPFKGEYVGTGESLRFEPSDGR